MVVVGGLVVTNQCQDDIEIIGAVKESSFRVRRTGPLLRLKFPSSAGEQAKHSALSCLDYPAS